MSTDFGKRLKAARAHAQLSQEQLAKRIGMAQSTLAAAESTGHGSRKTPQLAAACGVNAHWLATGEGGMLSTVSPFNSPIRVGAVVVAQEVSPSDLMIDPPEVRWESIMQSDLPRRFKVRVQDDAMGNADGSGLRAGDLAIFLRDKAPRPGATVLASTADGHLFIRRYEARTPGHWRAVAANPAYAPLDSVDDGLTVLAVLVGHLWD
jgi:SOS-response transcriptional repressor LexA